MSRLRGLGLFAAVALCALPARGEVTPVPPSELDLVLTSINTLPTRDDIELAFSGQNPPVSALTGLRQIIFPTAPTVQDLAVQLRAIRALPQFCSANCQVDLAHAILLEVITEYGASDRGSVATLRVRAAIEALGVIKIADDLNVLRGFLENSSRDIRVTTANALRNLCNTEAIPLLGARYSHEQVSQVRLAISAALRELNACSGS